MGLVSGDRKGLRGGHNPHLLLEDSSKFPQGDGKKERERPAMPRGCAAFPSAPWDATPREETSRQDMQCQEVSVPLILLQLSLWAQTSPPPGKHWPSLHGSETEPSFSPSAGSQSCPKLLKRCQRPLWPGRSLSRQAQGLQQPGRSSTDSLEPEQVPLSKNHLKTKATPNFKVQTCCFLNRSTQTHLSKGGNYEPEKTAKRNVLPGYTLWLIVPKRNLHRFNCTMTSNLSSVIITDLCFC